VAIGPTRKRGELRPGIILGRIDFNKQAVYESAGGKFRLFLVGGPKKHPKYEMPQG